MKETYIWVLLIVVILTAALYLRFFYQPAIGILVVINGSATAHALYPYQNIQLPLDVLNTGGSQIKNLSIGIERNGNLTTLYKVTLPAGKQTTIPFNYTPTSAGTYAFGAVADPGKLYNIADRTKAESNLTVVVGREENATPYLLLPALNMTSSRNINIRGGGYIIDSYIYSRYNLSNFSLTDNIAVNNFVTPLLDLVSGYIANVSVGDARYSNNSSAYSIWVRGYTSSEIVPTAESAKGLTPRNVTTGVGRVTFAALSNSTTLCSWYSGGWTKLLASSGKRSCAGILNQSAGKVTARQPSRYLSMINVPNSTALANYSGSFGITNFASKLYFSRNSTFLYTSIATNTERSNTCYGLINIVNGTSYCSQYIFPVSGSINGTSMFKTTAYIGLYNITVMSLLNTSHLISQVPINIGILRSFNVSGTSQQFVSGIQSTCAFSLTLFCSNITVANGTVKFTLLNGKNSTITLSKIACYQYPPAINVTLNESIASGKSANVTAKCYTLGSVLSGLPISLHLNLVLNYKISNTTQSISGVAYIPFG